MVNYVLHLKAVALIKCNKLFEEKTTIFIDIKTYGKISGKNPEMLMGKWLKIGYI